jgi:transcriptional regulator with PAS, ATPase and Fis domain
VESELFGHVRGAFTGASYERPGLLASAGNGTLFLDEIGELPQELQVKFFRVLQDGEFRPLGSDSTRRFEARVIAATNQDLERAVPAGAFRPELYFRLAVHQIRVPPLRDRREDIPALVHWFLKKHDEGRPAAIAPDVLQVLAAYGWPGNVRELENCVLHMMAQADGPLIEANHLPHTVRSSRPEPRPSTMLRDAERSAIEGALEACGGHVAAAARRLGISKATLYRKISRYGLSQHSQS